MKIIIKEQKYILILLTKYSDATSRFLKFLNSWKYTHASIGLDDNSGKFYSFVKKGFRIEDPKKHPMAKGKEVPCSLYRVPVSDRMYKRVQEALKEHTENAPKYKYSFMGVLLFLFKIPLKLNNSYFCSQFVAEVLCNAGVLQIKKSCTLVEPDDFSRIKGVSPIFTGTLNSLTKSFPESAI